MNHNYKEICILRKSLSNECKHDENHPELLRQEAIKTFKMLQCLTAQQIVRYPDPYPEDIKIKAEEIFIKNGCKPEKKYKCNLSERYHNKLREILS